MKFRVFWDVAPCRLWSLPTFRRCVLLSSSGRWWWRQYAALKRRSISTWLHGATSQTTLNFMIKYTVNEIRKIHWVSQWGWLMQLFILKSCFFNNSSSWSWLSSVGCDLSSGKKYNRRFRDVYWHIIRVILEALKPSETSVSFYQTIWRSIPVDSQSSSYSLPWEPEVSNLSSSLTKLLLI
jgi:hypothetical protein